MISRIRASFGSSVGSIVFGMEDGTVSIFGLVFGVAFAAPDSRAVLLAGATGAVAAAVSMMAGTFLDVESTNDQAEARLAEARARYQSDPAADDASVRRRLVAEGFTTPDADAFLSLVGKYPDARLKIEAAVDLGVGEATRQNPLVQAVWMFVTDLVAAAIPVIPFAFLALPAARVTSLLMTLALLLLLGVGRARVGRRRVLPTVTETIAIAAAAAAAGAGVGKLIG